MIGCKRKDAVSGIAQTNHYLVPKTTFDLNFSTRFNVMSYDDISSGHHRSCSCLYRSVCPRKSLFSIGYFLIKVLENNCPALLNLHDCKNLKNSK